MKRILLFKPGAIGDLLQITPVIRALRQRYPAAHITVMVGNRGTVPLFANHPDVAEVLVFDRKGEHAAWGAYLQLWRTVATRRFDLVVNFQRSNIKGWLLLLAAFPARYLVYHKARGRQVHAVLNHLETIRPLGIDPLQVSSELEFFPDPSAIEAATALWQRYNLGAGSVVALNPGASHPVNRWSTASFAVLADLLQQDAHIRVVLIGGGGDRELADEIVAQVVHPVVDLVGQTDISTTGAVLARCDVLVSGDTGPMHLATAVRTPVVALFGAADPGRTGPVGAGHSVVQAAQLPCVPCSSRTCANQRYLACMEDITPVQVLQVVTAQLSLRAR